MKAVLMSIHPKWCAKIFNGSKTIEVRKSRPSLDMPFKVYVYQTKHKGGKAIVSEVLNSIYGGGKVIGSFVCDKIEKIEFQTQCSSTLSERWTFNRIAKQACLTAVDMSAYLNGDNGYGWHITEPKLFDKPRGLGEFLTPSGTGGVWGNRYLSRPPMSWCYIEADEN